MKRALDRRVTTAQPEGAPLRTAFTDECAFSEEPARIIAGTYREVIGARRLESGKSRRREISVEPVGTDAVELTLKTTTDCTATGAGGTAKSRVFQAKGSRVDRIPRHFGN